MPFRHPAVSAAWIIDSSIDGIAFADLEGRVAYVNASFLRMWGYDEAGDVLGCDAASLAESSEQARAILASVLSEGAWVGTLAARRNGGERFIVEMSGSIVRDEIGNVIGMMSSFRDITDRARAEDVHRAREERYRSLVESAYDPIVVGDASGRYLYVNAAAAARFGTTPEHIVGKSVDDLFPPQLAQRYRTGFSRVVRTGESVTDEHESEINGRPVWFSTLAHPVRDRQGRVTAAQAVVRDITRLKQAEQALRESDDRLQQAIRVADIGIFDHDHRAETLYLSPVQRAITGLELDPASDGLLAIPENQPILLDLIHPEDRERVAAAVRQAHEGVDDGLFDVEYRIVRPDGEVRWVTMRSQTFFEGEGDRRRAVRTIGACRDITDRKLAEEERERLQAQLIQAQKMESVGRLAGGVAHDFNNMLNVIRGYAELVLEQLDPAEPIYGGLQEIHKAALRSADLTRQLLAFARKQAVAPRALNLNDVVDASLKMLRRLIGEDITLIWTPGSGLWAVQIDPAQIDQVLANLSANARDAIAGVGRVTIRTENVVLDAASCARWPGFAPGEYVRLEVTDNGRGMDQETQAHVFEPFFTTKGGGEGAGLGLATVYGIVRQNQGFVSVSSEIGRGTKIEIFLPRLTGHMGGDDTEATTEAAESGAETILLVEDEPMVLRLSQALLERMGYHVLPAGSPGEALRVAGEHVGTIHLLITDVVMPEMNGRDLARQLMARYSGLRCLFVSGYSASALVPHGVLDEGVQFLQKPFSRTDLAAKVREALADCM
jgi:PAS domain S-box-containing protein